MSDVVFTSSYCPVILGLGIQKNPSSNVALRKIREHGSAHGVDILYCGIWKMSRRLSAQEKYSLPNEKNSGGTSHQALTKFIFSEILIADFGRN